MKQQLEGMDNHIFHLVNYSPIPMLVITENGTITATNKLVKEVFNDEMHHSYSFFDFIQKGYREEIIKILYQNQDAKKCIPITFEAKTIHKKWLKIQSRFVSDHEQFYHLLTLEDITKQKQQDLLLELNQEMLQMIVKRESLHNVLNKLSLLIECYFVRESYCSIVMLDPFNKICNIVAPTLPLEYVKPYYGQEIGEVGSCGTAMYRKESVIVTDISTDPLWDDLREHTLAYGLYACWSVPIFIDEEVVGSFAIYHPVPSSPTQLEIEMIETCAHLVGLAIERIEAETRLIRETEKRFKFVMDLIPDLIVFKDEQGRWIEGNKTASEKLKFVQEPSKLNKEFFFSEVEEGDQLAWKLGKPVRKEITIPQPDGKEDVYDILKVPIPHDHILSKGLVVIGREITERKQTEKLLERKQQHFQSLYDHNPNGICMMNLQGEITNCNRSLEEISGYTFDELKEYCEQYLNESEAALLKLYFEKALSGETQHFKLTITHKNGNKVHLNVTYVPIIINCSVTGVYGIIEDITEKTKSEEQLKQTKDFLESLIEHSADCIGTLSLDGEILHVNPAIDAIYGWELEEIIGKQFPVLPTDRYNEMMAVIANIKAGKDIIGLETKRQKKDGTIIDVSITYSPLYNEVGEVIGFTSVSRDISDRKKTEELLKRSDKLSVIGQLSAAVAHEIRNPLTSIKGFIQLFRDRIQKEYTDLMLSELERIEVIVTEFLSLAKPQANHFTTTDPVIILKNTLAIIDSEALLNQIEIDCKIEEEIQSIYCNEHKIKQVLINILKNAIESMSTGGKLQIHMKNNEEFVLLEIMDEGCGIPQEKIKKLGEPFYSSKEQGTGLGLMVCFKILEEHKGHIEIQSEEGVGTTVSILLPIAKENDISNSSFI